MSSLQLRRLFSHVIGGTWGSEPGSGEIDVRVIRAADFDYVRLRATPDSAPERTVRHADVTARSLAPGDLIIEKSGGGELQPVGRTVLFDLDGLFVPSNFAARLRPALGCDPRFLTYLLASLYTVGVTRAYVKQTTGIQNLDLSRFLSERVTVPDARGQRAIADFLDTETARIDQLIDRKHQLIDRVHERVWASFVAQVMESSAVKAPLRRAITTIRDGPFGSAFRADDYTEDGAFVVRLGNIGFAEFRKDEKAFISLSMYETFLRHKVRPGDLLIAGLGDERNHAGRACVAPDLGPAIVKGKCFCAHVDAGLADATYLALYLSSPLGAQDITVAAHGATRSMINLEVAKAAVVQLPSTDQQRAIVWQTEKERGRAKVLIGSLERQISLLREHRQALIVRAIGGQLHIPGAAV